MSADLDGAAAVSQSVGRQLAAIDALGSPDGLGSEWSAADQIRCIRAFLEGGIDALARAEDARFDFLADCAMLASQNMQDARLHVTDERLADLENPESDATVGGFFVELGIILALELVVVATATYAVPALIALVAAQARPRAVRRLADALSHELDGAVTQRQAASEALKKLAGVVADKDAALLRVSGSYRWYALPTQQAMVAVGRAEREYALGLAAHEGSEALVKKVEAALAAADTTVPASLTSPQLQEMLDGALANTGVGRVAEQVATDDLVRKLLATTPDEGTAATAPFQTSSVVGRFLEANERARSKAAHQWGALRFHIRVLPDAELLDSEIAQKLLWQLHADPPPPGGPGPGPGAADAQVVIRGMEVVLWLAWMRQLQALGQRFVTAPVTPATSKSPHEGGVWEGMFVTSVRTLSGFGGAATVVDGIKYPGLLAIADGHARYLYGQFAREFFVRSPDSCPAPLTFDAARYDSVDTLPEGQERSDRIAEMKLLTIVFFQTLEADPTAIGSSGEPLVDEARETLRILLGLQPGQDIVAEFLASQPETSTPDDSLPAEAAQSEPDPALEALAELAAERLAQDDAAKLRTMVTDLDLLISQFSSEPLDDSAGLVERFAAQDLQLAIEAQRVAVERQYQTFLEHAAGQTALVDEVKAEYEQRIKTLLDWPPPEFQFSPSPR